MKKSSWPLNDQEWKINWIADSLTWSGVPTRLDRSHLYKFPSGALVYFENRRIGKGSHHYWVRITAKVCNTLCAQDEFRHVIFIDESNRAIILPENSLQDLRKTISQNGVNSIDLAIYPIDGFRVKGKNYAADWSPFVVEVGTISNFDRHRRAAVLFPPQDSEPQGQSVVPTTQEQIRRFRRSIRVTAWILSLACGKCENCDKNAPFVDIDEIPFLEIHHLKPLASGGPDTIDNAVAVCPNCHRELHYGRNAATLRQQLILRTARLKAY